MFGLILRSVSWIAVIISAFNFLRYKIRKTPGESAESTYMRTTSIQSSGMATVRACVMGIALVYTVLVSPTVHDFVGFHRFDQEPPGNYSYYVLDVAENKIYPARFKINYDGYTPLYISSSGGEEYTSDVNLADSTYIFDYNGRNYRVTNKYFKGTWKLSEIGLYRESSSLNLFGVIILVLQCALIYFNISRLNAIAVTIEDNAKKRRIARAQMPEPTQPENTPLDHYAELMKLNELKEKGIITEEEFLEQKQKILSK